MNSKIILVVMAAMAVTAVSAISMGAKSGGRDSGFGNVKIGPMGGFKMGNVGAVAKYDGEPKVVLKEMRVQPKMGDDVPDSAVLVNRICGRSGGFEARYLILAKDVVAVDYDGIVLDFIKDSSGTDYVNDSDVDSDWSCGKGFSSVNRESGFAEFMIRRPVNIQRNELLQLGGKVSITVADKMKTVSIPGKVSSGKIGNYKVKLEKNFGSDDKLLSVTSDADESGYELSVFCGDKELSGRGSMTVNGVKKLMFKKPASDDIVLKVASPDGGKKIVLPF